MYMGVLKTFLLDSKEIHAKYIKSVERGNNYVAKIIKFNELIYYQQT